MAYSGSCLCGALRYEFDGEPRSVVHCHCSSCRKATGSAVATWALVPLSDFRWTSSVETLREFASSAVGVRKFCATCGATLGNLHAHRPKLFHLAAGTLDEAPSLRVDAHVFVASKAPWHDITDTTPQFASLPPRSA